MKKIILFINPRSRNGKMHSQFVIDWLKHNQFEILNSNLSCGEDELCRTIINLKDSADLVIIGGGDGSLRSALPGLIESDLPLLYLPIGTLNNLARTLDLPFDVESSLKLIENHKIEKIQVGIANGILFHTVVGLGLSTQVNRLVRSDLKRWFGALAFFWTGLKVVYRMSPFRVTLDLDGKRHSGRSWQMTICNGRYYGSGFEISANASMDDGLLRGLSVETAKWWHAMRFIPVLLTKKNFSADKLFKFKAKNLFLSTGRRMSVDLDGDVKTRTPLELSIHPKRISILVPSKAP